MATKSNVKQFFYTSSKRGYGVYAESPEIKLDEKNQITVNIAYKRPQELIDKNETNLSKYPRNITRFKISNQKWVLAQSNYLGLDNTGRQGNFFSHVLLFDKIEDLSTNFLQFPFRQSLTNEELEITNPSPLPLANEPTYDSEAIYSFAKNNEKKLPRLFESLFKALKEKKKLAIVDSNENVFLWIQVLHEALPLSLVKDLEFATYVDRLTSAYDIIGVHNKEILRDTSRLVVFGQSEANLEISKLSIHLSEDYISQKKKGLFTIISNSYKRDELINRLPQLYESLGTASIDKDDFLKEIKPLDKSNKVLSKVIVSYLSGVKFLKQFSNDDFHSIEGFIKSARDTNEYYNFLYSALQQGPYDRVSYLYSKNSELGIALLQDFGRRTSNEYISYFNVLISADRLKNSFDFSILKDATAMAMEVKQARVERARELAKLLLESSLISYPANDQESLDNYRHILRYLTPLWSNHDEIRNVIKVFLANVINSSMSENQVINSIYLAMVLNATDLIKQEFDAVNKANSREKLNRLLEIYYASVSKLDIEKNERLQLYQALSMLYLGEFDKLSNQGQKKFYQKFHFAFSTMVGYKPNYVLIGSITGGIISTLVLVFFLISRFQPVATVTLSDGTTTEYRWFQTRTVGEVISVNSRFTIDDRKHFKAIYDSGTLPVTVSDHEYVGWKYEHQNSRYVLTFSGIRSTRDYYVSVNEIEDDKDESKPKIEVSGITPIQFQFYFGDLNKGNLEAQLNKNLPKNLFIIDKSLETLEGDETLKKLYANEISNSEIPQIDFNSRVAFSLKISGINEIMNLGNNSSNGFIPVGIYNLSGLYVVDLNSNVSNFIPVSIVIIDTAPLSDSDGRQYFPGNVIPYNEGDFTVIGGLNLQLQNVWTDEVITKYLSKKFGPRTLGFNIDEILYGEASILNGIN